MWKRAFQVAAIVSFAICLVVHVLWLRSYLCTETVNWSHAGGWRSVRTAAGHLEVSLLLADWSGQPAGQFHGPKYERDVVRPPFNTLLELCSSLGDVNIDWQRGGFAWYAQLNSIQDVHHSQMVVPCSFLDLATLALPLAAACRRLKTDGLRPPRPLQTGGAA